MNPVNLMFSPSESFERSVEINSTKLAEPPLKERIHGFLVSDDGSIDLRWRAQHQTETWSDVPRHCCSTRISKCNRLQRIGGRIPVTFCYVENGLETPVCSIKSRIPETVEMIVLMLVLDERQRQRYAVSSRWVSHFNSQCDGRELVILPPLFYRSQAPYDIMALATWVQAGLGHVSQVSFEQAGKELASVGT